MNNHYVVVWGRDEATPRSRRYATYTARDGRPLAFPDTNLWFADCPTVTTKEELDEIIESNPHQQVLVLLEDAARILGWDDIATSEE